MAKRKPNRKRRPSDDEEFVLGMAWYYPDQWEALRQVSVDVDVLELHYSEWLAHVNKTIWDLEKQGQKVRRVPVDVNALIEWCRRKQIPIDGQARADYTTQKMIDEDEGRNN